MYKLNNFDDLKIALQNDIKNPYNRSLGVRLLLVDSFSGLRELEQRIKTSSGNLEYAENYVASGKNWLSHGDIKEIIESLINTENISYLFSLDNILRFYNNDELISLLGALLRIKSKKGLVIITLAGLKERIEKTIEHYKDYIYKMPSRIEKVKMFVLNPEIEVDMPSITNFKEFMSCWKNEKKEILIKLRVIYANLKNAYPDTAVEAIKIDNYKDVLTKILGFKDEIYYTDEKFEKELIKKVKETNITSFSDFFNKILNFENFVELYLREKQEFKIKALLNYAFNHLCKASPELKDFLCDDKIAFLRKIYNASSIFDKEKRRKIVDLSLKIDPAYENILCEKIDLKKENILGILKCEKEELLKSFNSGKITIEDLKNYCEDFSAYLNTPQPVNLKEDQEWILRYFDLYKKSKLKDKILEDLEKLLNEKLNNFYEWYYSFDDLSKVVNEWKDKVERIIWIDGVGFEWTGYIIYLMRIKNIPIYSLYLIRSDIPSITEINKPCFSLSQKIRDFDSIIHEYYNYPSAIIRQMDKLKEIVEKNVSGDKKTLIFSDHGSSSLVRLKEPIKLPEKIEFEHGGRYTKGPFYYSLSEVIQTREGYYVVLGHSAVGSTPHGEAHGGATPEEIFTFALIVGGKEELIYEIELAEKRISRRKNKLKVKITPEPPGMLEIFIDGKKVQYKKEKEWYTVDLAEQRLGEHILQVCIGSTTIGREKFVLYSGIEEMEDFLL